MTSTPPAIQPPKSTRPVKHLPGDWRFVQTLTSPREMRLGVDIHQAPTPSQMDLRQGLQYRGGYPDPNHLLATAEADILRLLTEHHLNQPDGVPVILSHDPTLEPEAHRITCDTTIHLEAADVEGARRALYHLEDLLAGMQGRMIHKGVIQRRPWVRHRISRCFFGPIKRPPHNRDELANDIDYYPDAYLSRLASEGVNGLWITIAFAELCRTSISQPAADHEARLRKLRATVARCARYGIRIWAFAIEPAAWPKDAPILQSHPELAGAKMGDRTCFCPQSETAQRYLYESTFDLFSQVPGLGGLITISHGERPTSCLSSVDSRTNQAIACPRCSKLPHWRALHDTLSPMHAGMKAANPRADLISWLYMPTPGPCGQWVFDCASHMPPGVILQCNFESNVTIHQQGKPRVGGDYWLSTPGPSDDFAKIATIAKAAGTPMSAKLQVACSHEVATVPMVAVPGLIHQKFHAMQALGCQHAMFSWYFGNYPGLMNRAANLAAFNTPEVDQDTFLAQLARRDWGDDAPRVTTAWKKLADAYEHYPLTNLFQYYGPMHTGPLWQLHLEPVLKQLARTWLPDPGEAGDVIGECLGSFTLDEALALCHQLADGWKEGCDLLESLLPRYQVQADRLSDIHMAMALAIQFDSGRNILAFYQRRQQLTRTLGPQRQSVLQDMRQLVQKEIGNSQALAKLCRLEPTLGFHSESEGYQYTAEQLQARAQQLQSLLSHAFPKVEQLPGQQAWPTWPQPRAIMVADDQWREHDQLRWRARYANAALEFDVLCDATGLDLSVVYLWLLDEMGTQSPQIIRCQRDDPYPTTHSAKVKIQQLETATRDLWQIHIRVEVTAADIQRNLQPRWFSILHNHHDTQNRTGSTLWPKPQAPPPSRLLLSRFSPHESAALVYTTH